MKKRKAEEILRGLTAAQNQRFVIYAANLSTDKDPKNCDGHMISYIEEVCLDKAWVKSEIDYLKSIGWNQSKYCFEQMKKQAERFTDANHPYFGWNKNFQQAKERRVAEAKKFGLRALQYQRNEDIEDALPRKDTHAGFSAILTGKKKKGEYCDQLLQNYQKEVEEARKNGSFNKPIIVGSRTQASDPYDFDGSRNGEYDDKTRLVSMIDIYQIMAEVVFAKQLQTKLSTVKWYAGGKNDRHIIYYMRLWANKYSHWVSIDYSKYDQSISAWLIREAFDVVRVAYCEDPHFDEELFRIVREDFINKVLILGPTEDLIYESDKGVPSGSMFTQIIDSIVNILMIDTYMISIGVTDYEMMIMGDDNIIFTNIEIDTDKLETYLLRNFGITMHAKKCEWKGKHDNEDPVFLSRVWTQFGVYRKPEILLAKLVFPETYRDYKRNKDLSPNMIVQCFVETYPRGMEKFISWDHNLQTIDLKNRIGDGRWMSGLMRYRALYAS